METLMFVAPTEPALIQTLGTCSSVPEKYGVDLLWATGRVGLAGVQRKTVADLLASATDGRLQKEVAQMDQLPIRALIVEGRPSWTFDGQLVQQYGSRWTRAAYRALLWSIQDKGVWVEFTDSSEDTVMAVQALERWTKKEHQSMRRRPKPGPDAWGTRDSMAWQSHLLQSIPTLGPGRAEKFIAAFGGKLPLGWTCTRADIEAVPGIGPKLAQQMWELLGTEVAA